MAGEHFSVHAYMAFAPVQLQFMDHGSSQTPQALVPIPSIRPSLGYSPTPADHVHMQEWIGHASERRDL